MDNFDIQIWHDHKFAYESDGWTSETQAEFLRNLADDVERTTKLVERMAFVAGDSEYGNCVEISRGCPVSGY